MSIENKINNIVSSNENNNEVLKNEPELIKSYKNYERTITKLKLSSLANTINSTPSIKNGMENFVDNKLLEIDAYIDSLIDNGNLAGLNSVILRSTNFIQTKINTFTTQANRVKRYNEKKKEEKKEALELNKYNNKTLELKTLLDNNFENKLKHLDSLFKDEGKFQYYDEHFKLEDALGEEFKDIDEKYKNLPEAKLSLSGMQQIFLNQGLALSSVNTEILEIINNYGYSTAEKTQKINLAIQEIKEFEQKVDDFIEQTKQIEELDETEIDDKLLKTVIKGTGLVLSEAAKIFVAPIGFWVGISENASGDTNTGIQDSAEFAASFIPIIGNFVDFAQAISGETYSGRKLSTGERFLAAGTGTLGLVIDLTGVGYFLKSGGKLAVKGGTTIAKGAIRGSDDLLKATVKDSGFIVGGFNKMKGNFKANFGAAIQGIAEKKLGILKEYSAYAKQDMKSIVGVDMVKGIGSGMKAGIVRGINFTGEKASWDSWKTAGHSENLSKLEKTDIIKDAGITVDKDGKITDSEIEISRKIDVLLNGNKITHSQILDKIDSHKGTDEEKVRAFMMEIGITDKSIIGEVKESGYDKNLLSDLIIAKQDKQLNNPEFIKFKENIKRNLYKKEQYFDPNYVSTQRNLSDLVTKINNKEDTFMLFGKDYNGETLTKDWYKTNPIQDSKLDTLGLGTNGRDNIYEYIKKNKISNVDDLTNQLKRDNKLNIIYDRHSHYKVTRKIAEQAWDNAFTTKLKNIDDEISSLGKEIKALEKSATKIDNNMILSTSHKGEIIKTGSALETLQNASDTKKLFNNLDEYGDIKILQTKLDNYLTKHEVKISEFKSDYNNNKSKIETQIIELKAENRLYGKKASKNTTLINQNKGEISTLEGSLSTLKSTHTTELGKLTNSKVEIEDSIEELVESSKKFDKTHKNTTELKTKKESLETKKEEKTEIEKYLSDAKERDMLFKEISELDITKVKSSIVDNYMKSSSTFIQKNSSLDDVINNIKTTTGETNPDILNNTALYIWKIQNPNIGDSLELFINKMGIKDHDTIFKKLSNEKGRAQFSDLLEKLETELKNTENKFGEEYLTKLKEYNNLHFLGKNSNTLRELFNYKKALDNGTDPKIYLARNPNLKKIMDIPELAEYIKNPTKLEQLFGALGKFSMKAKIAKKVVDKVTPGIKKTAEKAKNAFKNATEDYGK